MTQGRHDAVTSREPNPDNWLETAVVLLIPYLDNPQGCENDLAKVKMLVDCEKVLLSHVWDNASRLLDDPDFRRRARAVEGAFMAHPDLSDPQGCENDLAKVKIPKPDVILNPATGRQRSAERHEARYQTSG